MWEHLLFQLFLRVSRADRQLTDVRTFCLILISDILDILISSTSSLSPRSHYFSPPYPPTTMKISLDIFSSPSFQPIYHHHRHGSETVCYTCNWCSTEPPSVIAGPLRVRTLESYHHLWTCGYLLLILHAMASTIFTGYVASECRYTRMFRPHHSIGVWLQLVIVRWYPPLTKPSPPTFWISGRLLLTIFQEGYSIPPPFLLTLDDSVTRVCQHSTYNNVTAITYLSDV